jgi:hypothetical protein
MIYRLFKYGFPTCHVTCARNYFAVLWDIGDELETRILMGLN